MRCDTFSWGLSLMSVDSDEEREKLTCRSAHADYEKREKRRRNRSVTGLVVVGPGRLGVALEQNRRFILNQFSINTERPIRKFWYLLTSERGLRSVNEILGFKKNCVLGLEEEWRSGGGLGYVGVFIRMSGRPRTTSFAEGTKPPANPPLGGMKISSE